MDCIDFLAKLFKRYCDQGKKKKKLKVTIYSKLVNRIDEHE